MYSYTVSIWNSANILLKSLIPIFKSTFHISFMSYLPLFGLQILLHKYFTKNKEFSSFLFVIFGIICTLFFTSNSILLSFILWEFASWTSYFLLAYPTNIKNDNVTVSNVQSHQQNSTIALKPNSNHVEKIAQNLQNTKIILISNIIGGLGFAWACCILLTKCNFWSEIAHTVFSQIEITQIIISLSLAILSKSSQLPFNWLVLTEKSSSLVSAYLHSTTVVQMGLYLLFQISSTQLHNSLLENIILISSIITSMISIPYFYTNNLKKLTALTSQINCSLFLATSMIFGMQSLKFMIISHAIYKSFLFILCDYIYRENGNYNIQNIKRIPVIYYISLILCCIPMMGIPYFYFSQIYSNSNIIIKFISKVTNTILLFKIFSHMYKNTKITSSTFKEAILLLPIIFLIPSAYISKFSTILTIILSCIIYAIFRYINHLMYKKNTLDMDLTPINITNQIYIFIKKIPIPSQIKLIEYALYISIVGLGIINFKNLLMIKTMIMSEFLINSDFATKSNFLNYIGINFIHSLNYVAIIWNVTLICGCILLFKRDIFSKIAGLSLVSVCITNYYITHQYVDVAVTNIVVDFVITILIILSKNSLHFKKFNIYKFMFAIILSLSILSLFKDATTIIHYPKNTSVNDVVVFYRAIDTLGETVVIFSVGLIALIRRRS